MPSCRVAIMHGNLDDHGIPVGRNSDCRRAGPSSGDFLGGTRAGPHEITIGELCGKSERGHRRVRPSNDCPIHRSGAAGHQSGLDDGDRDIQRIGGQLQTSRRSGCCQVSHAATVGDRHRRWAEGYGQRACDSPQGSTRASARLCHSRAPSSCVGLICCPVSLVVRVDWAGRRLSVETRINVRFDGPRRLDWAEGRGPCWDDGGCPVGMPAQSIGARAA